ncbi:glycosyltransferase [Thermococcus sp. 101 C5]|uniref:glycosyltransferase n=1 Tax=Thermococcus sp. 101 C5 TaxID=2654197 RepID=UPI00128D65F6|nr:glycosyltransferase [Thermococcus sp. 101 C5]MPW38632.1 glycosyltransferase [Thermococcus sp. 101 C5]
MRYVILARNLDSKAGGIGVYGRNLIKKLEAKGIDVIISPKEKLSYFKWLLFDVPIFLLKTDADVYHAIGIIEGILLPFIKPRSKKYLTVHDLIPLKYRGRGFRKILERFLVGLGLFSARFYDKIFTVSHLTKLDMIRFGGIDENKIKVVYQPIDDRFLKTPISGKRCKTFNIGYISRMEEYKRHELLIKLFMEYKNPNARLYLAGTGHLFKKIQKLVEKDKRIVLLGFVPDDKIVEFYDMLDVYIHPSKYEGWGLPIVEAIARKKPVIILEDAEIPKEIKHLCLSIDEPNFNIDPLIANPKYLKKVGVIKNKAWRRIYENSIRH